MKNVLSFSLFGDNPKYTLGAIENAKLHRQFFKDWEMRVYHNNSVPIWVINELINLNVVTINTNEESGYFATLWRFIPMSESGIKYVISRDCDSRIFERDECSVNQWIESDKKFHIIRDHPVGHGWPINAGMFGCRNDNDLDINSLIREYLNENNRPDDRSIDQCFLRDIIYPKTHLNVYVNDEYFNYERIGEKINRDRKLDNFAFIGEPFDENNNQISNYRDSIINSYL